MKTILATVLLLPFLWAGSSYFNARPQVQGEGVEHASPRAPASRGRAPDALPVVLELFTSQGCSSCPPADRVLAELSGQPGVIALSFHVDYWDYLGWKDPFSSPYYSARQTDYTEALGSRTYTPQVVVNGRGEVVGSRKEEVGALVRAAAARQASAQPAIVARAVGDRQVDVGYTLPETPEPDWRVTAILVQNEAGSSVIRGENRGRELRHANVVRDLRHQKAKRGGTLSLTYPAGLEAGDSHIVLLVQDARTQAIVGAVRSTVSRP